MRSFAITLVLGLASTRAFADDPKLAEARVYFERGKTLYDAGDYKKAVEEYLAAYKRASFPELIFNIGQAYRLSGNSVEALKSYELFLQQQPGGPLADEARSHVLELRTMGADTIVEQPKQSSWDRFNATVKTESSAEIDMRPHYTVGARASLVHDGKVYGAQASYFKRLGRWVAFAPRAQLGLALNSISEFSFVGGTTIENDRTDVGFMAETQARVLFPVASWFYLGSGLSLAYISNADQVSESDSSESKGAFAHPIIMELGFVILDRYEIGIQLAPIGLINDDFISAGEQVISVAASYRLWK